jgi:hypothetical protein
LRELKFGITEHRDLFVLEFDVGRSAFEVKAGADFFGRGVNSVAHFDHVGFANGIKRGHGDKSQRLRMRQFSHVP